MDVAPIASAAAPAPTGSGASGAVNLSSDFETFLRMLTVQMQNQDPLNPLDSTEFAEQLATFSSVEQQVRTNDLLTGLTTQMNLLGLSQLSNWVGREARVAAPVAWKTVDAPVELFPNPPVRADRADLVVRDAAGAEVYRAAVPLSLDPVHWNGTNSAGLPVADGRYSFTLESFSYGDPVATQALERYAPIDEARNEGGTTYLLLAGGIRVVASDVKGLREPL
jgi:flagellar basal-body rod modification protein FlgD